MRHSEQYDATIHSIRLFTFASGLGIGAQVGMMLVLWCILG